MAVSLIAPRHPLTLAPASRVRQIGTNLCDLAYRSCTSDNTTACGFARARTTPNIPSPTSHTPRRSMATSTTGKPSTSGSGPFSFHVAASFIGKDRKYDPLTHIFHFNPYNRIQQTKSNKKSRPNSGHDAFFVSRVGETGAVALGVADGVGGWVDSGVDPADFSHGLCDYVASAAYEHGELASKASNPIPRARNLLQAGYQSVCEDRTIRAGGSTACVAVASPAGTVDVANLGDSGFIQLRLGAVYAHTEPQTHAFNTPFQLSVVPPSVAARMAAFGGAQLSDFPRDADVTRHDVRRGDVLIFASDGVWDNLFNQDILRVVTEAMTGTGAWLTKSDKADATEHDEGSIRAADDLHALLEPKENGKGQPFTLQSLLAVQLTAAAKAASINTKMDGPFAKEVQKWYPHENWRGGKVDDIVVVVAVVDEAQAAAQPRAKL